MLGAPQACGAYGGPCLSLLKLSHYGGANGRDWRWLGSDIRMRIGLAAVRARIWRLGHRTHNQHVEITFYFFYLSTRRAIFCCSKARYLDNIFIERLWRSLKYECVYLHAWEIGSQARAGVVSRITLYNRQRPHATHGGKPPTMILLKATQTDQ